MGHPVHIIVMFFYQQICGKMEEKGWGTSEVAKTLIKSFLDRQPAHFDVIEFFNKELQ